MKKSITSGFVKTVLASMIIASTVAMHVPPVYAQQSSDIPVLGDAARAELSPAMEMKIGREIMFAIRTDPSYVDDPVLSEYLMNLGNKLVSADPVTRGELLNDFEFFAIKDPTLNAFALPGGYIGVHTGLLLATQTESELASVLSHEIGHVSQRHIARMITDRKHDIMIPIATAALAILASQAGAGAAGAVMMGGQGFALQRQINFTREAEKEADRVGFQILKKGGFETQGMASFFKKLQYATRTYNDAPSPYLRTHPLTSERIADAAARAEHESYRQHADNIDFYLMRSRARVLQDDTTQAMQRANEVFDNDIRMGGKFVRAAGYYGRAVVAIREENYPLASQFLKKTLDTLGQATSRHSLALINMSIQLQRKSGQTTEALKQAQQAMATYPSSRSLTMQYADSLYALKRYPELTRFLRKQSQMYRDDPRVLQQLAKVYSAQGKVAPMHLTMAEAYALMEAYPAALEQLNLARKAKDVTFYDHSIIDAHEREWKTIIKNQDKEKE